MTTDDGIELDHHGDRDAVPGLIDLAVNVRAGGPPGWLRAQIAAADLAAYPDATEATKAVAARHGRAPDEVLLTAGAAEAFVLLARALTPRHAVVVHPQFTEPEVALRAAGHHVERVVLPPPFTLDPSLVPDGADVVVVGNPTNPTSVTHPAPVLRGLRRPGRLLVVDEAFADCVPDEPDSLASDTVLDGTVIVRSLTKTWGLPGLRVGYVLAAPDVVERLRAAQPPWAVSSPALAATVACSTPQAVAEARDQACRTAAARADLVAQLSRVDGVRVIPDPAGSFVLLETPCADVRERLVRHGFAVRRGETFPGLGPAWIRVAVRDAGNNARFALALADALAVSPS